MTGREDEAARAAEQERVAREMKEHDTVQEQSSEDHQDQHNKTVWGLDALQRSLERRAEALAALTLAAKRLQARDAQLAQAEVQDATRAQRLVVGGMRDGLAEASQILRDLAKETVG